MKKVNEMLSKYNISTLKKSKAMVIIFFALSFANFVYDIIMPLIVSTEIPDNNLGSILFFLFSFLVFFFFFRALQITIQNKEAELLTLELHQSENCD